MAQLECNIDPDDNSEVQEEDSDIDWGSEVVEGLEDPVPDGTDYKDEIEKLFNAKIAKPAGKSRGFII